PLPIRDVDVRFDFRVQVHALYTGYRTDNLHPQRHVRPPVKLPNLAGVQTSQINPFADRTLVREAPFRQRFAKDCDARGFQRIAPVEDAALPHRYAQRAEIVRGDALRTDTRIIFFPSGLPVFDSDLESRLDAFGAD